MLNTLRKIIFRVLIGTVGLISLLVVIDWIFVAVYANRILGAEWWVGGGLGSVIGRGLVLTVAVLFPILYLLSLKISVIGKACGLIWEQCRDDVLRVVVDRVVNAGYKLKISGNTLVSSTQAMLEGAPRWLSRLLGYLKDKIPLVSQTQEVMEQINRDEFATEQELSAYVMQEMSHKIEQSDLPIGTSVLRALVIVNLLLLCAIVFVLGYVS